MQGSGTILELPDYKKIASEVRREDIKITNEEVNDYLRWLQKSRAKFSQITRSCRRGDFVEIEFSNSLDEGKHKDAFILGDGKFIPGFEDKIVGMFSGEEREFSLKMPESYPKKDAAGKTVLFKVRLHSVQKMELPELNDELARSLGNFENLKSLKDGVASGLKNEKENAASVKARVEILEKIMEQTKIDAPENLVRFEQKHITKLFQQELSQKLKLSLPEYLAKTHQTEKDIEDFFLAQAQSRTKEIIVLGAIAEKEQIKAPAEEVQRQADDFLKKRDSAAAAEATLDPGELRLYIEEKIRVEKTLRFLEGLAAGEKPRDPI